MFIETGAMKLENPSLLQSSAPLYQISDNKFITPNHTDIVRYYQCIPGNAIDLPYQWKNLSKYRYSERFETLPHMKKKIVSGYLNPNCLPKSTNDLLPANSRFRQNLSWIALPAFEKLQRFEGSFSMIRNNSINYTAPIPEHNDETSSTHKNLSELLDLAHQKYNQGNYQESIILALEVLKNDTRHLGALLLSGCCHYSVGDYASAIDIHFKIIQINPKFYEAYSNLGCILREIKRFNEAEFYYKKAIELNPASIETLCNLGSLYAQIGRVYDAISVYNLTEKLLGENLYSRNFFQFSVKFFLGNLYFSLNDFSLAESYFRYALNLINWTNLDKKSIHEKDMICYIFQCFGKMYNDREIHHLAFSCYLKALKLAPNDSNIVNNIGISLSSFKNPQKTREAIDWFFYGLSIDPKNVHLYANLGSALKELEYISDSVRCYLKAIEIRPDFYIALANLGNIYKDIGRHEDAIEYYRAAIQQNPHSIDVFASLVYNLNFICDWKERSENFYRILEILDNQLSKESCVVPIVLPFHTFTYPVSIRQIRQISSLTAHGIDQIARNMGLFDLNIESRRCKNLFPGERIRVGYVSSDFGDHPLSHLMQSIFSFHDRENFEIFCYALSKNDHSNYRSKIERDSEHFLDVSGWTSKNIIERIVADQIHVLVNLNGYTKGARNEIFSARPCEVQISLMGFAGTMGADWIDFAIVDEIACARQIVEKDGRLFTEKLIYMPDCYFVNDYKQCYREGITEIGSGSDFRSLSLEEIMNLRNDMRQHLFPHLNSNTIIFANFNQIYKIEPFIFQLWLRILEKVPNSILWLLRFPGAGEKYIRSAAEHYHLGCCPSICPKELQKRLVFSDVASKFDHIRRGSIVDLFLDTPECNGHTTAADILWAGTPMITFPKVKMCSRVAASLCFATGLGDQMVVRSYSEYESRAVYLARNPEVLHQMRTHLISTRDTSPLFDTKRWVKNFEKAIKICWVKKNCIERYYWVDDLQLKSDDKSVGSFERRQTQIRNSIPENLNYIIENMNKC